MQMEMILLCKMYLESVSPKMVTKNYVDNN